MTNPFDITKNINTGGPNLMRDTENDELAQKGYPAFVVNRAFSYTQDTLHIANVINQYHQLDARPQYEFLKSAIRPKKRYGSKWAKPETNDTINTIAEHYKCNRRVAEQYLTLMTQQQIDQIIKQNEKGGRDNGR